MTPSRRVRLMAFFLPICGLMLIMPPLVFIFDHRGTLFGVPIIIAFFFLVWLAMIVATFLLQRHLPTPTDGASGRD